MRLTNSGEYILQMVTYELCNTSGEYLITDYRMQATKPMISQCTTVVGLFFPSFNSHCRPFNYWNISFEFVFSLPHICITEYIVGLRFCNNIAIVNIFIIVVIAS